MTVTITYQAVETTLPTGQVCITLSNQGLAAMSITSPNRETALQALESLGYVVDHSE